MFSSNQILKISGDLGHENDLRDALDFALKKSDHYEHFTRKEKPSRCVFQITPAGDFCIGWACSDGDLPECWAEFQFDFDVDIISAIVKKHLLKQEVTGYGGDGTNTHGFLMQVINSALSGVENPFYGIVKISSCNCYYAK